MAQILRINETEYIPSGDLAKDFDYTTDYVTKLARDGKVAATQIGRQWFVERTSMEAFVHEAQQEKDRRAEDIRRQRQAERLLHEVHVSAHAQVSKPNTIPVRVPRTFAQAVIVVVCGFFVGYLGWVASAEGLQVSDFAFATGQVYSQFVNQIIPPTAALPSVRTLSLALLGAQSPFASALEATSTSAVIGVVPAASEPIAAPTADRFSDEVRVTYDKNGVPLVQPIFRNNATGTTFKLVPDTATSTRVSSSTVN